LLNDIDTNFFVIIGGLVGETGLGDLSGVGPKPDAEVTKARGVIPAGLLWMLTSPLQAFGC
jgi:hypothetical protein